MMANKMSANTIEMIDGHSRFVESHIDTVLEKKNITSIQAALQSIENLRISLVVGLLELRGER